ncbi:hypothetical protein ACOMHN_014336 [Nucella lapillus]
MDDDGLYDVPRGERGKETPPSLPPKKSSKSSSFRELDGLSTSSDPRPKPKPRKTVRSSSSISDQVTSPTTPKPVPRPRPGKGSAKSPDEESCEADFAQNLPPSADEVEELVNRMVESQLAAEEAEESRKQPASWPLQPSAGFGHQGTTTQGSAAVDTVQLTERRASAASVESEGSSGEAYENSEVIKSLRLPPSADSPSDRNTGSPAAGPDQLDAASGEYAQVHKPKGRLPTSTGFESDFDPFVVPRPNQQPVLPSPVQHGGGMLQPTKVWENPGYACSAGIDAVGKEERSGTLSGPEDSSEYEAVWFGKGQEDGARPGMVKPRSPSMTFTPKPSAEGVAPQSCEPSYGERNGEYIELDPTYNVPPPSLPPPPLPPQTVVLPPSRPPSIPPRPRPRDPHHPPDQQDAAAALVLQDSFSHLGESCTEQPAGSEEDFEALPTPGFTAPFDSDDPFKYSDFGSECRVFNHPPLSTGPSQGQEPFTDRGSNVYEVGASENVYEVGDGGSVYKVGDSGGFVVEWPAMEGEGEGEDTYQEIGGDAGGREGAASLVGLNQVPPPLPAPGAVLAPTWGLTGSYPPPPRDPTSTP